MPKVFSVNFGLEREKKCSRFWHTRHLAILVSSLVLRSRGLGQIDLCFKERGVLVVVEVKSYRGISPRQWSRLKKSCQWLGALLNRDVVFRVDHLKKEL